MVYGENSVVCWESGMSQEYSKHTDRKAWLLKDNVSLSGIQNKKQTNERYIPQV